MVEHLGTLMMLIFLQAVLGFDNLLYISIESKRVEDSKRGFVQKVGIGLAIVLRIVLLIVLLKAVDSLQAPLFELNWTGVIEATRECGSGMVNAHAETAGHSTESCHGGFSGHALIVLGGGAFILYTAIKEIWHMMSFEEIGDDGEETDSRSVNGAIFWIVVMNLVFSFDSILSAMALTKEVWVMATAIIISGVMMMVLAEHVSEFLKRNRMYEVLGLFILFLVGVMLVSEAGHLLNLKLMGSAVAAMPKSTFYFVLIVLVLVDMAQARYQKKIDLELMAGSKS